MADVPVVVKEPQVTPTEANKAKLLDKGDGDSQTKANFGEGEKVKEAESTKVLPKTHENNQSTIKSVLGTIVIGIAGIGLVRKSIEEN